MGFLSKKTDPLDSELAATKNRIRSSTCKFVFWSYFGPIPTCGFQKHTADPSERICGRCRCLRVPPRSPATSSSERLGVSQDQGLSGGHVKASSPQTWRDSFTFLFETLKGFQKPPNGNTSKFVLVAWKDWQRRKVTLGVKTTLCGVPGCGSKTIGSSSVKIDSTDLFA